MSRESKIRYNQHISIAENAKRNNVSEEAIRYYIKTRAINRRDERRANIVEAIQSVLKQNPQATKTQVSKLTQHSINTVRKYWELALGTHDIQQIKNKRTVTIRQFSNFYATHPLSVKNLLKVESFDHNILEPFCGTGSISEVLKNHDYNVLSYDLVDRGYGRVGDFFKTDFPESTYDIISNPPYDEQLSDIILRSIAICKNKVAFILPLKYLSGRIRYLSVYKSNPPSRVYVYMDRIPIAKNGDFDKYKDSLNQEAYCWVVWDKQYRSKTELRWLAYKPL